MPERSPKALLADKGYDADAIRADLASRNSKAVIPGRSNRRVKIEHDRVLYKQRNGIERMFGSLKINRAIATRYDQLANSFMGMVHIATARYWLKFVHAAQVNVENSVLTHLAGVWMDVLLPIAPGWFPRPVTLMIWQRLLETSSRVLIKGNEVHKFSLDLASVA